MIEVAWMIVIISVASALRKCVDYRTRGAGLSGAEDRLATRMGELDRRLTDIQDVMINLDEKMSRNRVGVM